MRKLSRREFFGTAIATAGVTSTSAAIFTHWRSTTRQITASEPVIRGSMTPTSQVSLGKSGLHVSMVGVGTVGPIARTKPSSARANSPA